MAMKIIKNSGRNFPVVEMTLSEYQKLPDYSICYPIDRPVGDIGKIPGLSLPDERLIEIKEDECVQIMYCEIIEEISDDNSACNSHPGNLSFGPIAT
jgi:hypothetical protein